VIVLDIQERHKDLNAGIVVGAAERFLSEELVTANAGFMADAAERSFSKELITATAVGAVACFLSVRAAADSVIGAAECFCG